MDPFTQRMLERARARREKLDNQLSNAGHNVKKKCSPLKDANIILAEASVPKIKTPTKSTESILSPIKSPPKSTVKHNVNENDKHINKENEKIGVCSVRSKLQRLGKLYSDDNNGGLSSPIHRTEEKFNAEEEVAENKPPKKGARLDRLAALASTINNWEDDLSHPPLTKSVETKKAEESPKNNNRENCNTPEKTKNPVPSTSNTRLSPRFGFNGSPKSSKQSSPGSVLSKASLFESKNSETKDPAQMTLSERMALFERNKGVVPLLPKAPLTMSVPLNKLQEKDKINSSSKPANSGAKKLSIADIPSSSVNARREKFEQGLNMQASENNILKSTYLERQQELDVLRSQYTKNKELAKVAAGSCIRISEGSKEKSNSPENSPFRPLNPTTAPVNETLIKRQGNPPKTQRARVVSDVKKVRVPPPKPGHIYPNLSDIDNTTETETDTDYTVESTESRMTSLDERTDTETGTEDEYHVQDSRTEVNSDEEIEDLNTSLGRSILQVVKEHSFLNKKRSIDPDADSTTSDISVLDKMDEYLDECLTSQEKNNVTIHTVEGPTPAKVNKGGRSPTTASTDFEYSEGPSYRSPIKEVPPGSPKKGETYIVDGDNCVPLLHTVSLYRRQQQSQTPKTPVRVISRTQETVDTVPDATQSNVKNEAILVQEKIKRLLDEVCKQQTIIGQASQALNLCTSTVEFNDSREQVEGERLLLVATHRRQAALNEVQRLKIEGTLRPVTPGSPEIQESGSLTVSDITLPLKRDYLRNMDRSTCFHFVCLIRHLEDIVATPVVVLEPGDSYLRFPSTLKLNNLYSDFKITIEVYSLRTHAEILPHEIKYHINNSSGCSGSSNNCNKKLVNKTPKKFLKQESRLVMPSVQSPAGPSAVRSPAFQLSGYVIFSLREIRRQQFTLNKVPPNSLLDGQLQMHVSCELSVTVEHRGFLTMFEDVSGFGAWHRRWCLLKGSTLSYWKYPDDERKQTPIGSLDLQNVSTTNVELVSRDICARPNTFLLETTRPSEPGDTESLIMIRNGPTTTIRHLLSADTKEDRLEWCSKLNKTLNLIHTWGRVSVL